MDKDQIINIVRAYKESIIGLFPECKVYLFGSYNKGCATKDSDIDVAVVVPHINGDWLTSSAALWKATWNVNTLIEPVLLEQSKPSPLYDEVIRTGLII